MASSRSSTHWSYFWPQSRSICRAVRERFPRSWWVEILVYDRKGSLMVCLVEDGLCDSSKRVGWTPKFSVLKSQIETAHSNLLRWCFRNDAGWHFSIFPNLIHDFVLVYTSNKRAGRLPRVSEPRRGPGRRGRSRRRGAGRSSRETGAWSSVPRGRCAWDGDLGRARVLGGAKNKKAPPKETKGNQKKRLVTTSVVRNYVGVCVAKTLKRGRLLREPVYECLDGDVL